MNDLPTLPDLPSPELPEGLRAKVAAELARGGPPPARGSTRFVPLAAALGLQFAFGLVYLRPNFRQLEPRGLAFVSGSLLLLSLVTLAVALAPGRHGLGAGVTRLAVLGVAAAPLYAATTLGWPLGRFDLPMAPDGCLIGSLGLGATVVAGLAFALRRGVPAAPVARAALVGATGGAWAGLAMHLHCPACDRPHILIGHVVPIVVLTVLSAVTLPRWLRP